MIPITKPFFDEKEREAVRQVLDSGWVVQGPKVKEFEKLFASFTGAEYAVATTSCTTALHLSLAALGVKAGDEVIVPAFTFIATANVVEQLGAKPVFVDIDPLTFNINTALIEKAITEKTKAVIPVHLFGLSADMEPIIRLAKKYRLKIVEDAACGLGATYKNKHVGAFGAVGCFSFHPRKIITTGEGGIIITSDKNLADKLRSMRDHGAKISDLKREKDKIALLSDYHHAGFNYRMTDIQAAVGIEQMKKLPGIIKQRQKQINLYNQLLGNVDFKLPIAPPDRRHGYQTYVIQTNSQKTRNNLLTKLATIQIGARQGTHSVPHLAFYRNKYGYQTADFPASYTAEQTTLALPLYHSLTLANQKLICQTINRK